MHEHDSWGVHEEGAELVKLFIYGLAGLGIASAIPLAAYHNGGDGGASGVTTSSIGGEDAEPRYELRIAGRSDGCFVAKGETIAPGRSVLKMAAQCILILPRLSEATYWQEGPNGEVVFMAGNGRAVAEFYMADGVAYESLRPVSPPMALIAR